MGQTNSKIPNYIQVILQNALNTLISDTNNYTINSSNIQSIYITNIKNLCGTVNINGISNTANVSITGNQIINTTQVPSVSSDTINTSVSDQINFIITQLSLLINENSTNYGKYLVILANIKTKLLNYQNGLQSCIINSLNSQTIDINGITANTCSVPNGGSLNIQDINNTINSNIIQTCINKSIDVNGIITDLNNLDSLLNPVDTNTTNTTTPDSPNLFYLMLNDNGVIIASLVSVVFFFIVLSVYLYIYKK